MDPNQPGASAAIASEAQAHFDRGLGFLRAGRADLALADFDRAIALQPDHADAHINRGAVLQGMRRIDEALAAYDRAIALKSDHPVLHNNRGAILQELGRLEEALVSFGKAALGDPGSAGAHYNRGNALRDLGRLDEALAAYNRAVAIHPGYAEAYNNRGLVLMALGRPDQALTSFEGAIRARPAFAEAHNNRAAALKELKRLGEALESAVRAIALKPGYAEAHQNRANILEDQGRLEEALAGYGKAVALKPGDADIYCNQGVCFHNLGRFDEALASHDRAIDLKPDHAQAHYNRATTELLLGRFESGWRDYEWRKRMPEPCGNRTYPRPLLTRLDEAAGKTVLVHGEQGLGDTMQFFRYCPLLQQAGGRVLFAPQAPLKRLLGGGTVEIVDADSPPQIFDYHIPLMSLPLLFGTDEGTIPAGAPYLKANEGLVEKWRGRLGNKGRKIGICWQGNPALKKDVRRSFSVSCFAPLTSLPGVRLISLHKGSGGALPEGIESLGSDFDTAEGAFMDTAAVMRSLDLVVTSDTSIAHLAGALGVPAFVALQHVPDWRWMLDRADSPWYPSLRLFRQQQPGDWSGVFAKIAVSL